MSVADLQVPPANTCAEPRTAEPTPAGANDLHWSQKRRPQPRPTAQALRRRVRPAIQNVIATAQPMVVRPLAPLAAQPRPENALLSERVGRLKLTPGFDALPALVRKGQLLGEVEALSLSWPIQAPADGVVLSVLSVDGAIVEYAQPLFEFATKDSRQTLAA